ncbi:MAG TPA: bifunctional methylenetetrahydrofolate dehydrogenase/methenyltetrahydrofolate cyclohydrolase FolD [Hyphomicrobiaceae bacterium]|nr:bifunctional methylenetetrahydrofolate dehydrogenase/methenyltetrahydrofolate cyclohydrolase FolD [Hyphomicrobiaceae bacterium]
MGTASIIDGKAMAEALRRKVAAGVGQLEREHGLVPGLAVVLVGEDPASRVYVRNKVKQTVAAGMRSFEHYLPETASEAELLALIARLNQDAAVHGILVQLPLPQSIDSSKVIEAIDPAKDVDGFHPFNVGRLAVGAPALIPCTPLGIMLLIRSARSELSGLDAVVIGRSNIVGKPVAQLLLAESCTVTIGHSRTHDLPAVARRADILVSAVGRPGLVRRDWIKPGAIVIDVGINRVAAPDGRSRLAGDVAFEEAVQVASAVTPVPGGVGPMTIACLLRNTLTAASAARGVSIDI